MLALVGLGLAGLSLLLNIIGLAIPYWLYNSKTIFGITVKAYSGLWKLCGSGSGGDVSCLSYDDDFLDDAFKATRALELLGMLLMAGALVCVVLKLFMMKEQKMLPLIGGGLAVAAGVLMIIGTIVFATRDVVDSKYLHAGFGLCIVAGILGIVAGIVTFVASKNE